MQEIAKNIYSVGAIDYDVREFHGYETPYGTTYNAYLVIDEKNVLIDSVKAPFADEMIANIKEVIDPAKIDMVISNHVEPDHSGAIGEVLKYAKGAKVYTSPNGEKGLRAYYGDGWELATVKTGDTICSGKYNFVAHLLPMIHWPDSMCVYNPENKILFSNDAFGQHYASAKRFADEFCLPFALDLAQDYYANIVMPFGTQVKNALDGLSSLDIDVIAPSHGLVWRTPDSLEAILKKYEEWATGTFDENKVVIVFDSMWGSTNTMAKHIASEFAEQGKSVQVFNLKDNHISKVMAQVIDAKYICVGSSTLNRNYLPKVAAFLTYMKGLAPKGRTGLAFGSYGWSGESIPQIHDVLEKEMKFEMLPMRKVIYRP